LDQISTCLIVLTLGVLLLDGEKQHHDVEKESMFHSLGFAKGFKIVGQFS
jgi:hypothetical protein